MLFVRQSWPGLADGSITVAFRRWKRPTVKTGGTLRSPVGMLAIDDVRVVDTTAITDADVERTGFASRAELFSFLDRKHDGSLYRIEFHRIGDDDRIALREQDDLTADERASIDARLARLDRASNWGPWTAMVLAMIRDRPAVRAGDLAADVGRERLAFKNDVRKLKALGLTESLEVGYRLSPRGRAYLDG